MRLKNPSYQPRVWKLAMGTLALAIDKEKWTLQRATATVT
jgi:hypothetical protein